MKKTDKNINGVLSHGVIFSSSVSNLIKRLGTPTIENNCDREEIKYAWNMETEKGVLFMVSNSRYKYRLELDDIISWVIFTKEKKESIIIRDELIK
jgi:hypothetical protein